MDASLYQLALRVEPAPQPLAVSATTLKSLLWALMDVLIDQQLPAKLWVKLPPGEGWQAQIKQYQERGRAGHTIYVCNGKEGREPEKIEAGESESGEELENSPHPPTGSPKLSTSQIIPVQLKPESAISREYFLLVLSERFCGLILAHRPRSAKPVAQATSKDLDQIKNLDSTQEFLHSQYGHSSAMPLGNRSGARAGVSDSVLASQKRMPTAGTEEKRGRPLLTVCAFDKPVIQEVLQGIRPAIALSEETILTNWDKLFTLPQSPDLVQNRAIASILTQLLVKQVQQQEEIGRGAAANQASTTEIAELQRQNQALLDEVRFKDELLSNALLELRTPLTNMKTALTLLESAHLKPTQRHRYLHLLHTQCDRQVSLISGLMELVQLDRATTPTTLHPVQLADIVPGVVSTYQAIAQEKGIQLGYTVSPNLPTVSCLEAWLRQIIINLLHNSIKFTPTGGQVVVRTKQQGEYVQLEFRDTGIGIAPNELPKIFDRFYRGRLAPGEEVFGAGLGLTIVQQLLLRCAGSISVTSKLGQGSTFKVLFPVHHSTSVQS
ncbi:DICT sensory domain-containing protein [Coleofasciculus sp. H7-2]|uniref:DICT sensory domain-containing protein n=1 Tax=Coleofasciculus sp. H7-2 TaxID=3351545 RepID=UPI00366D47E9